jgi:DNA helicase-2/ATP-dependent DNA helicase PcrA
MIDVYLTWQAQNENQVIDVEMKFEFNLGGRIVKGFIDRVERTPEGNYVVIDFKTGYQSETKNSIKENIQMNVYCLAVLEKFGALPLRASLFYVKHEKMVDYFPDSEQLEQQKMRLTRIVDEVLRERFPGNRAYQTCRFCDYEALCEEKEIRVD